MFRSENRLLDGVVSVSQVHGLAFRGTRHTWFGRSRGPFRIRGLRVSSELQSEHALFKRISCERPREPRHVESVDDFEKVFGHLETVFVALNASCCRFSGDLKSLIHSIQCLMGDGLLLCDTEHASDCDDLSFIARVTLLLFAGLTLCQSGCQMLENGFWIFRIVGFQQLFEPLSRGRSQQQVVPLEHLHVTR